MDTLKKEITSAFTAAFNEPDSVYPLISKTAGVSFEDMAKVFTEEIARHAEFNIDQNFTPEIAREWLDSCEKEITFTPLPDSSVINNYGYKNAEKILNCVSEKYDDEMLDQESYNCEWCAEQIMKKLNITRQLFEHEELQAIRQEIGDFMKDNSFSFPSIHINGFVKINLTLAYNNEVNYDFSSLSSLSGILAREEYEKKDIKNNALTWLVYQQGYTLDDLFSDRKSPFLNSVREELENFTSSMGALTFCIRIDSENLENIITQDKNFILSDKTRCGIFSMWDGSGSNLGIVLEKDVVIPQSMLFDIQVEDTKNARYTVDETYGLVGTFWANTYKCESDEPALIELDIEKDIPAIDKYISFSEMSSPKF